MVVNGIREEVALFAFKSWTTSLTASFSFDARGQEQDESLLIMNKCSKRFRFLPDPSAEEPTISAISPDKIQKQVLKYVSEDRHEMAMLLCTDAVDELERTCGHAHPNVATILSTLAQIYHDQCNNKEARRLLKDVLAIREKTLGVHPDVVATLHNLNTLYDNCGNSQQAEIFCSKALDIQVRLVGENHPDVANNLHVLAFLCQNQQKFEKAGFYYERALQIYEAVLRPDDPNTDATRNNLAICYVTQGKFKDAEILYKIVLTRVHELKFGPLTDDNKTIWQMAEQREVDKGISRDNTPYNLYGNWHRIDMVNSSTVQKTLRKLGTLYRKHGKHAAASTLTNCPSRMTLADQVPPSA
ncbi:kinesin light chain-like [Sabethes cyaneus]|uniref:kinesin light chain-like n=1 Tax=Sabethes cyaneus TaxID=53552 RepID=UPI00237E9273|nr:kinesin light chain-like [Sabethes cyaneus]